MPSNKGNHKLEAFKSEFYKSVTHTVEQMLKYPPFKSNKFAEICFKVCIRESQKIVQKFSTKARDYSEVIIDIANDVYYAAISVFDYYRIIDAQKTISIRHNQTEDKYKSQAKRIFKSAILVINREEAECDAFAEILSNLYFKHKYTRT